MEEKNLSSDSITFLGTAGARITVTSQILASGGMWLSLGGTEILLDPGPGCIVQSTKRKLKADKLSAIILSHRHLDHSADVNIMVEAMTRGGFKQRGRFFAPADALENEPVIFSYLKGYLEAIEVLQEGRTYSVDNISFTTPVRHIHPVENFDGLCRSYGGELLIINVVRLKAGHPFDHLAVPDAQNIITKLKPKVAVLTHFGMTMWRAKPWEVAEGLSEETGVRVIAARDGMKFDLSQLSDI